MTAARGFPCCACHRVIGERRGHHLTDDGRVLCTRCLDGGSAHHACLWPDCPTTWHDPYDHLRYVASTRAATARMLTTAKAPTR